MIGRTTNLTWPEFPTALLLNTIQGGRRVSDCTCVCTGTSVRRAWSAGRRRGGCACTCFTRGAGHCCWRARRRYWTRWRPQPRPTPHRRSCAPASGSAAAGSSGTSRYSSTFLDQWAYCSWSTWRCSSLPLASSHAACGAAMKSSPRPRGE